MWTLSIDDNIYAPTEWIKCKYTTDCVWKAYMSVNNMHNDAKPGTCCTMYVDI